MQDIFEWEVRDYRFTTSVDAAANVLCPCTHTLRNVFLILVAYIVSLPLVHVCAYLEMQKEKADARLYARPIQHEHDHSSESEHHHKQRPT